MVRKPPMKIIFGDGLPHQWVLMSINGYLMGKQYMKHIKCLVFMAI